MITHTTAINPRATVTIKTCTATSHLPQKMAKRLHLNTISLRFLMPIPQAIHAIFFDFQLFIAWVFVSITSISVVNMHAVSVSVRTFALKLQLVENGCDRKSASTLLIVDSMRFQITSSAILITN